ncbi:MAG TPA: methyltransferase domain-containing protein [Jatrophihabitans sp.]|nr:methyltransferase domain-containing protein [Jatrophihabitans sp.]
MDQSSLIMHQVMLGDSVRLHAYDQALRQTVRPGDIVVDVGAGTLILSLLALRHGAVHVYAIEGSPEVAALACAIAKRNHLEGRVTIIQGDARTVELPTDVDVIVSEMMGNLGPEEQMAEVIEAVARRHLKPSGRVIPQRVETRFQAVQFDGEGWGVWSDDFWGYSLSPVQDYAPPAAQLHFFNREPIPLSPPVIGAEEVLGTDPGTMPERLRLDIVEPGSLHAIIGYFRATLADGVSLSNHPGYPGCNWAVWVWPVRHTPVRPGMSVEVKVERPTDVRIAADWRLDCSIVRTAPAGVS